MPFHALTKTASRKQRWHALARPGKIGREKRSVLKNMERNVQVVFVIPSSVVLTEADKTALRKTDWSVTLTRPDGTNVFKGLVAKVALTES